MKYIFSILFLTILITACNNQKLTHQETVFKYYDAKDALIFSEVEKYIHDTITIKEGDYVMPYTRSTFYEVFKWDSIFQPSYEVVEIEEKKNHVFVSVALSSIRNEFLKNKSMTCQYKLSFILGKISKIESLECVGADWNKWQTERDSLVNWISKTHPELDGFIHNMTMQGAQDYLKAIELYKTGKKTL